MSAEITLSLLAPVLELAIIVAQAGERTSPPVAAPVGLRPFLHFTHRVPAPALRAAKKVLDENYEYRVRVATVATEELVGRAGVLFVHRPDGWEDEVAMLLCDGASAVSGTIDSVSRSGSTSGSGAGRQLERKLRGAEEATRRAEAAGLKAEEALIRARADAIAAQASARDERAARREADEERAQIAAELAVMRTNREALVREVGVAKATIAALQRQVRAAEEEISTLREAAVRRASFDDALGGALRALDGVRAAVVELRVTSSESISVPKRDGTPIPPGSRASTGSSGGSVGGSSAGSVAPVPGGTESTTPSVSGAYRPTPSRAERARSAEELRTLGRRVPLSLPLAVFEESTEAVQYLIRTPNVIVLVDGYNVTKQRWGDRPPSEQRQRLVDSLGEVEARTGAEIHVVFDGAEIVGPPPVPAVGRRPVRVSFSPPDVEADDVLIGLAASLPVSRPLVVVSGDKRVQDGVRRHGANTVSSIQFLSALGASPGSPSFLSHPSR